MATDSFRLIASRPQQVTTACYPSLDEALRFGRELALAGWYVLIQEAPALGRGPLEVVVTCEDAA